jgi:hypothetical protein
VLPTNRPEHGELNPDRLDKWNGPLQVTENAVGDARFSSCESENQFQPVPRYFIPLAAVSQDQSTTRVALEST